MNIHLKSFTTIPFHDDTLLTNNIFSLGYYVKTNTPELTRIILFSLKNNYPAYFRLHAPEICSQLLKQLAINKTLDEINWSYASAPALSILKFIRNKGKLATMHIENDEVFNPYAGALTLKEYENLYNESVDFKLALQKGFPINNVKPSALIDYLVHTPKRNEKIRTMTTPYGNDKDYKVILVDTNRFMKHWEQQSKVETGNLFNQARYFIESFIANHTDYSERGLLSSSKNNNKQWYIPHKMACGVCLNHANKISFTNGRHRTINLANAGAPFIPLQVANEHLADMRKEFEWNG